MAKLIKTVIIWLTLAVLVLSEVSRQKLTTDLIEKAKGRSKFGKGLRFPRPQVMEDLFNVYDTGFLAIAWPKLRNGVHLTVEPSCWYDMSVFFKDLLDGKAWAYSVVDACGRQQSGLFEGNQYWVGSKRECLKLDKEFSSRNGSKKEVDGNDDYNVKAVWQRRSAVDKGAEGNWHDLAQPMEESHNIPPYGLSYSSIGISLNITKKYMIQTHKITLGMCLPESCKADDIRAIFSFSIMINNNLKTNGSVPRDTKIIKIRTIEKSYDFTKDATALVLISFTISLLILTAVATAVDFDVIKMKYCIGKTHNFRINEMMNPIKSSRSFDIQKSPDDSDDYTTVAKVNEPRNTAMNNKIEIHRKRINKTNQNDVDLETLTINNINNCNHINLLTLKQVNKADEKTPSITLDVVAVDETNTNSCRRCGKYKKQVMNPRKIDNLPACPRMKYSSFASLNSEHYSKTNKDDFCRSVLLCFSLKHSWSGIFNTRMANKDLTIVHCLKVAATLWVLFVHVGLIVSYLSDYGGNVSKHSDVFMILSTGSLAFDTLIFVSGVLSSHHFFYLKSRYTVQELVSFGGVFGHILQFICFVTNRAVRLLPPYFYTVFLSAVLARISLHTSVLELPEEDHTNCDRFWWRNFLYVSNYYANEEKCLQISWYLSLEAQLHALGTLLLCLGRARLVTVSLILFILATLLTDFTEVYRHFGETWLDNFGAYTSLIERPWARISPYFIGIYTGWLVHRLKGRLQISKVKATVLWSLCLIVMLVTSLHWMWTPHQSWMVSVTSSTVSHLLWSLALAWPTIVLSTCYCGISRRLLESSLLAGLSRLSYTTLLLHGAVARSLLLSVDATLSMHSPALWSYFAGTTLVSVLSALVLSLLLETPCCSLLRRISDCAYTRT